MSSPTDRKRLRGHKLPLPKLQWRLIGAFVGLSALALLMQYVLFGARISRLANRMPTGGEYLTEALPSILLGILSFSMLVLLPMSAAIGILITFRWAGPVYRFHQYLREVSEREVERPCRIRENDELQELCTLINSALEATRERAARGSEPAPVERENELDEAA